MSKFEDLLKILTLGMIADFSGVLYRPRYETKDKFVEDIPQERLCFRVLWKTFAIKYATMIGGIWVHPSYIYKAAVVGFAVALIRYRNAINNVKDAVTANQLEKAIKDHFVTDHPDLVHILDFILQSEEDKGWLVWNGPPIVIVKRSEAEARMAADGLREARQHSSYRIY